MGYSPGDLKESDTTEQLHFTILKNGLPRWHSWKKNLPVNAGDIRDAVSIPGSGKSPGEGDGNPLQYSCLEVPKSSDRTKGLSTHSKELGFSGGSVVKNPPANAGDVGLFPGPGRSLEKGNS